MLHSQRICVICSTIEESHDLQIRLQSVGVHWLSGRVYLNETKVITIGVSNRTGKFCMMDESSSYKIAYQEYIVKYLTPQSNTNKMLKAMKCTK